MLANLKASCRTALLICVLASVIFGASIQFSLAADHKQLGSQPSCGCKGLANVMVGKFMKKSFADDLIKQLLRNPYNPEARLAMGMYYEVHGMSYEALSQYTEAERLKPSNPGGMLGQARVYMVVRQFDLADRFLSRIRSKFPDVLDGDLLQFMSYSMQGKPDVAERWLNQRIHLYPNNFKLKLVKATLLAVHNHIEESLGICNQVLAVQQNYFPAIILKTSDLKRLGHNEEAFRVVFRCFEEMPYEIRMCWFYLRLLLDEKRPDLALEPALAMFALSEPGNEHEEKLARLFATSFLATAASQAAEQTIARVTSKLTDKKVAARFQKNMGDVFDRLGRPNLALQHYSSSLLLSEHEVAAYMRVARYAETRARDCQAALAEYEAALKYASPKDCVVLLPRIAHLKARVSLLPNDVVWQLRDKCWFAWLAMASPLPVAVDLVRFRKELSNPYALLGLPEMASGSGGSGVLPAVMKPAMSPVISLPQQAKMN